MKTLEFRRICEEAANYRVLREVFQECSKREWNTEKRADDRKDD
jgi:hypothetical protein